MKHRKCKILTYLVAPIYIVLICVALFAKREYLYETLGEYTFNGKFYSLPIATWAYEHACSFPSPSAYSCYQYGRTLFIQGNMSKAIFYFDKEISLYPNNSKTYYMKGLALGYSKREQEAIESFKIYVEKNPTTWAGRNDLAWLQFRVGDIDGALATIEVIAKKDPNNPWIANTYGVLLYNKQRYREAKEVLTLGLLTLNNYTSEDWGKAYPGNNPIVYSQGLLAMKNSFRENIALVNKALVK